jgi:hypothetical protein
VTETTPITVQFVGAPVQLMRGLRLHLEAVTREFQLIEFAADDASSPPARLLELTARMRSEYDRFGFASSRHELSAAIDRDTDTIEFELVVPPAAGAAARVFLRTMDEADEWCERGELLTLASPPEQRAFRRWFFGEIERQVGGAPALAWAYYVDADATS